jgi:hypothetical protein
MQSIYTQNYALTLKVNWFKLKVKLNKERKRGRERERGSVTERKKSENKVDVKIFLFNWVLLENDVDTF